MTAQANQSYSTPSSPLQRARELVRDVRSHGLRATTRKRLQSWRIGDETLSYADLLQRSWPQLEALFDGAIAQRDDLAACWVFEAMLYRSGDFAKSWDAVTRILGRCDDRRALDALDVITRSVEDPWFLSATPMPNRCCYLLGRVFFDRARAAQGKSGSQLELNRSLALTFLGFARERLTLGDGVDRLALAAAYEAAMYARFSNVLTPNE